MKKLFSLLGWALFLILLTACSEKTTITNEEPVEQPVEESQEGQFPTVAVPSPVEVQFCTDPQPGFIMDLSVYNTPEMPEPAERTAFRDPVFGTCMVRVTNREKDIADGDSTPGLKNEYSRVQSFNADESLVLVRGTEGSWYVYDARALTVLTSLPIEIDPRWDGQNPSKLYFNSATKLIGLDLSQGKSEVVHDFAADLPSQTLAAVWMRYEGSPSVDTRYWGLMAEDEEWTSTAFLVYDLQTDQVIATRDLRAWPAESREIDSVSMSPLGNYFLAYTDRFCENGLGSEADPCGLMVYDRNLQNGRSLLPVIGHSDLALDAQGREVLVFQDVRKDEISILDLATGVVTPLFTIDFSHSPIGFHFSGQAFRRPGWVVVSTYSGARPAATWMDDQVFALELKPGGRVVRLAHTHSIVDENKEHDYWAEPQASVNRDFTHVLFTSNWGRSGSAAVEMYMLALRPAWIEQLP